ncbi:uncharacterized protein LOC131598123 [Vicia villosa]|uniref:uncharacterized protein LOC131598123 n=1 Tax=Vicia villosa TaxID=3911 RepID=UPI00273CA5C2|nr:uncharacterized protein LOC131598123 [Vicia villosa]
MKQRVSHGQRSSEGDASTMIVCFKCGQTGHKSYTCNADAKRCFRCGEFGHAISDCKHKSIICFNCREEGHIGSQCPKNKAQSGGKVFALARTPTASGDRLVRGIYFINSIPLITIIDIGATHCFIASDYVERLGLILYSLNGEMVVDLPAKGSVTTSLVCSKCPLPIFDIDFVVDLICLPLSGFSTSCKMSEYQVRHHAQRSPISKSSNNTNKHDKLSCSP